MKKLIILDYVTGETHIYNVYVSEELPIEEVIERLGFNTNDCHWMCSSKDIIFHGEAVRVIEG